MAFLFRDKEIGSETFFHRTHHYHRNIFKVHTYLYFRRLSRSITQGIIWEVKCKWELKRWTECLMVLLPWGQGKKEKKSLTERMSFVVSTTSKNWGLCAHSTPHLLSCILFTGWAGFDNHIDLSPSLPQPPRHKHYTTKRSFPKVRGIQNKNRNAETEVL